MPGASGGNELPRSWSSISPIVAGVVALLGLVAAVRLIYVLGVLALPALIGSLIVGGLAAYRGLTLSRALGAAAAAAGILLVVSVVLYFIFVPTTRVKTSTGGGDLPTGVFVQAPTTIPIS